MFLYPGTNGVVGVDMRDTRIIGNQAQLTGGGISFGSNRNKQNPFLSGSDVQMAPTSMYETTAPPPIVNQFSATNSFFGQNVAENGGAISFSGLCGNGGQVPVFGPNVTIDANFANKTGGGAFYQLPLCNASSFVETTFSNK